MKSRSLRSLGVGFLAGLTFPLLAYAETYRNAEFGFSVDVPDGAPTCRGEPPEHNHGLDIFLDDGADGCRDLLKRPFVGIFATYNAMFDPNPEAHLQLLCNADDGKLTEPPDGLRIDGRHSAICRLERTDGWIEVRIVAQNVEISEADALTEGTVPGVNYEILLRTKPERYHVDLVELRTILSTVHIFEIE